MSYEEREPIEATVAELKPRMKNITITFKVVAIGEEREVTSRNDGATHRVADATVGDSTGSIILTLWDADIEAVNEDSVYMVKNGYVNIFGTSMRLAKGKYGEIQSSDETIDDVNEENNRSNGEHQRRFRKRRPRGGGSWGGGGDRRDRRDRYDRW